MKKNMDRREFVAHSAAVAGVVLGSGLFGFTRPQEPVPDYSNESNNSYDLMSEVLKYRKIDAHAHVGLGPETPRDHIDIADRLGIETLVISKPVTRGEGPPSEFIANNEFVLKAVKEFPDRFKGQMTVNPRYPKEAMDEINRRVDQGFVGMKLYTQVKINDPAFYPIIERFIELKMIILMHTGIGNARVIMNETEPEGMSMPEDFVDAAKRYPEAMFQLAHLGGGIDWENACKTIKDYKNIYVDVSGSNNQSDIIDYAMKYLGEDRMFFGCDNSFYQGVGHVIAANLTERQREKIYFENYNNILRKAGNHVD